MAYKFWEDTGKKEIKRKFKRKKEASTAREKSFGKGHGVSKLKFGW